MSPNAVPGVFCQHTAGAAPTIHRMAKRLRDLDDGPSDADIERFSDVTQTCPSCGTTLYDDVEVCWKCGHALGSERRQGLPLWLWITAAGLLALAIGGMLLRL